MAQLNIAPYWTADGARMILEIEAEIQRWKTGDRPEGCATMAEAIARCIVRNHFDPSAAVDPSR